jgi:hypothetical protein
MRTVAILVPLIEVVLGREVRRSLRRPTSIDFACALRGRGHPIEKNPRQINGLGTIWQQKWFPLSRIMF